MMTCVMPPTASSIMVTPKKIRNELKMRPRKLSGWSSSIAHRADGDQRHVERVEGGIMLDPYETQRFRR